MPTPVISSFSPSSASRGDALTVYGRDLGSVARVLIGGIEAPITFRTSNEIRVTVPQVQREGPQSVAVETQNGNLLTATRQLEYTRGASRLSSGASALLGAAQAARGGGIGAYNPVASSGSGLGSAVGGLGGQVASTGAQIGTSALGTVLSPLGASGSALAGLGGSVLGAGASLAGTGLSISAGVGGAALGLGVASAALPLNLLAGGLRGAGSLASGIGSLIPGVGGAIGGVASSVLGGVGSLVSAATAGVTKIFTTILDGALGVVGKLGEAFGPIGKVLGDTFSTVLTIGQDVLQTAKNIGNTVSQIGFNSGIGNSAAARLVGAATFTGVDTGALGNAYAKPFGAQSLAIRAQLLGLSDPTNDPENFLLGLSRTRQQYGRQGAAGAATFNALLGPQLGSIYGGAAQMSEADLKRNFALSRSFQLPSNVGALGGNVAAAENALSGVAQWAKVALAETILPLLPKLNQGFQFLISHKDDIASAITSVGKYLVSDLPVAILHFGATLIRTTGKVFEGVGNFLTDTLQGFGKGLLSNLTPILQGVSSFLTGMGKLASISVGLAAAAAQGLSNFSQTPLGQKAIGSLGITPGTAAGGASGGTLSPTNVPAGQNPYLTPGGATPSTLKQSTLIPPNTVPLSAKVAAPQSWWDRAKEYGAGALAFVPGLGPAASTFGAAQQLLQYNPEVNQHLKDAAWGAGAGFLAGGGTGATLGATGGAIGGFVTGGPAGAVAASSTFGLLGGLAGGVLGAIKGGYDGYTGTGIIGGTVSTVRQTLAPNGGSASSGTTSGGGLFGGIGPVAGRSIGDAFLAGQSQASGLFGSVDLTQYQGQIEDALKAGFGGANTAGNWLKGQSSSDALANSWDKTADNWRKDVLTELKGTNTGLKQLLRQSIDETQSLKLMVTRLVARTSANIAEDYVQSNLSSA